MSPEVMNYKINILTGESFQRTNRFLSSFRGAVVHNKILCTLQNEMPNKLISCCSITEIMRMVQWPSLIFQCYL